MTPTKLPFRQVHLDFHTGPNILDVGTEFDPTEFAKMFKRANVNSVTVFAKCHHGHLYYDTARAERHPGLKPDLNLLGLQLEALHRNGIRAPIYLSVQCDEYAANTHPEWVARNPDSSQVKWTSIPDKVFGASWQILDMATDYQEFLAEQTREVLKLFHPVDGLFFDMCWNQVSTTAPFMKQMIERNLNPEISADREQYARTLAMAYMKRFHGMVKDASPNATVYFNSRPLSNLASEIEFLGQVEIEALPTGGWGYLYFPKNVRFARTFDREYLGMTARFHKSWADFGGLKPYAALEYETSQMLAHGAKCSIGDQLHPRGKLDLAVYDLIGKVYARVTDREPWCEGAKPVTQIGLFQAPANTGNNQGVSGSDEGATRMLTQLKHQFDVVHTGGDFGKYELLVLPDSIAVDETLAKKLQGYLKAGGALLASGTSGLSSDGASVLLPELGIESHGLSPFTTTYVRFADGFNNDVPPTDHVMYEKGIRVTPTAGSASASAVASTVAATVVEPYFERAWNHFSSHFQTPGNQASKYAAAVYNGKTAYIAFPIFAAFAQHGNYPYRFLVRNLLEKLLPEPLVRISAPTSTEASLMQQNGRQILHLLQYCPERRTEKLDIVEDIVPIFNVPVSVKMPKAPKQVYLAPERTAIEFTYEKGRVNFTVPKVNGHAMIVLE